MQREEHGEDAIERGHGQAQSGRRGATLAQTAEEGNQRSKPELPQIRTAGHAELEQVDFMPFAAHADAPMAMTAHVVYAQPANEWKDFVPLSTTPWMARSAGMTGGFYEIDLTGAPAATGWTDVP